MKTLYQGILLAPVIEKQKFIMLVFLFKKKTVSAL